MTDQQLENQSKVIEAYKGPLATVQPLGAATVIMQTYRFGSLLDMQSMSRKELIDFSKMWEGEKGWLLLLDGEPRSHVAEDLLLAAGFSFYRLQGGTVKRATYKTRPDGARGARGWAKTDLTPDQVRKAPYALWM